MGKRFTERSRREFDVAELVEILNSEDQTSSSSLATPLSYSKFEKPPKRPGSGAGKTLRPPLQSGSSSSPSSDVDQETLVTDREGRTWCARTVHSFSPPERDRPRARGKGRESSEAGDRDEQTEVFRSIADSERLVKQLRAKRRARKESRGHTRRRKGERHGSEGGSWGASGGEKERQAKPKVGWRDTGRRLLPNSSSLISEKLDVRAASWGRRGAAPGVAVEDPFLQAISMEDALLSGEEAGTPERAGGLEGGYLDLIAGGTVDWPRGGQLQSEWQSLASLLKQSLAGVRPAGGGDSPDAARSTLKGESAHMFETSARVNTGGTGWGAGEGLGDRPDRVHVTVPHPGTSIREQGRKVGEVGPQAPVGYVSHGSLNTGVEVDHSRSELGGKRAAEEVREEQLSKSSGASDAGGPQTRLAASRGPVAGQEGAERGTGEQGHIQSVTQSRGGGGESSRDSMWPRGQQMETGAIGPEQESKEARLGERQTEELTLLGQALEKKREEVDQLLAQVEALQAAVSEKAAAVAALSSRLEQQQAEHAQALQALRAEFAQERQALAERAQADREASTAALQARLTAAERARQEGAAKAEEQERLVKEGKRREARLQETNRALLQRVKVQKAENEAVVRELEAVRGAVQESAGLLEAARREGKALRAKLEDVGHEKEAETAGAERAREAGARLRRELAEVKAALKTAEAAQARCQAESVALRKRVKEAEDAAEQERAEQERIQARQDESDIRQRQLEEEVRVLQARLRGRAEREAWQPDEQGGERGPANVEKELQGRQGVLGAGSPFSSSGLEQETDEDSVSFLTPSPDTSPEKVEESAGWGAKGRLTGEGRTGHAGAPAARSIRFAGPVSSREMEGATTGSSDGHEGQPPVRDAALKGHDGGQEKSPLKSASAIGGANTTHQSLSSSDSSLDGPPKPWAWASKLPRANPPSNVSVDVQAVSQHRNGHRIQSSILKGSELPPAASAEAQSKFHDLKDAYLRVLQTRGARLR